MKKIAIIAHSLGGGGVERVILNLSLGFHKNDKEVHLIILKDTVTYDLPNYIHLHKVILDGNITNKIPQIRPYFISSKIKKILKDIQPDVLISNFTDFRGMKIVDLLKFPRTITIVHNTQSKRRFKRHAGGKSILKSLKKYRIEKSFKNKHLVCVSKGVQEDLQNNFNISPKSIQTIYNPFDFETTRKAALEKNKEIPNEEYLIHVGRFEIQHKRQDLLLQAYKKSNISNKLFLLGDGQDRSKIEQLIKELDLTEKVVLQGFEINPYNWIANAKLFIFTSDYEGLGMVLVESLMLHTPVVSTNCPHGPSEILTGKLSEYLTPIGDADQIASKMKKALDEYPEITDAMLEKFHVNSITQQYLSLFENIEKNNHLV